MNFDTSFAKFIGLTELQNSNTRHVSQNTETSEAQASDTHIRDAQYVDSQCSDSHIKDIQ